MNITDHKNPTTADVRTCPVCGSEASRAYDHPEAALYLCGKCSHCFSDPSALPMEDYGPEYYERTHKNWFRDPNIHLFKRIWKAIRIIGPECHVLDIGCGRGDLLRYLHEQDSGLQLTGIELSELPPSPPIRFIKSDIFELELREKFDVVLALGVIEHVADAHGFVRKLVNFTKPGGSVIVMTVNSDSLVYVVARVARKLGWSDPFDRLYSRHHLQHYNRRSLATLLECHGLQVREHLSHNFPLSAVDFPSSDALSDAMQLVGVAGCFGLGKTLGRAFLQTAICAAPSPRTTVPTEHRT